MRLTKIIKSKIGLEDNGQVSVRMSFDDGVRRWEKSFFLSHPMDAKWYDKLLAETHSQLAKEMEGKTIKTEYSKEKVRYYLFNPMYHGYRLQEI